MPPSAPTAPSPMRTADLALVALVLAGAALTAFGWTSADRNEWLVTEHAGHFLWLWAAVLALVFVSGRAPFAAGAVLFGALTAATGTLGALLAVAAIAWSAATLGRLLLRRWPEAGGIECLLVGLAVFGTGIGLLVHLPVNYPGVHAGLLALPLLLGRGTARETLATALGVLNAPRDGSRTHALVGSAAAALAGVHLLVALMPEVGYDALVTHLLLPAHVHHAHAFDFDVDRNVWAVMPLLGDWLYTLGYSLAGETGSRLVNFGCILLLAALIRDLARWAGADRIGATSSVLIYLATPLTMTESSSLFIESVWSCMVVGGAAAVFRTAARDHGTAARSPHHVVVAGALLGGALAAKAVTFVVLPVLTVVLLTGVRRWARRDHAAALLAGAAAFVAIGALPYVRAYVLTGNPVFPFYNALFRSPHYPPENFAPPPAFDVGTSWDTVYRITFESGRFLESRLGAAGFHWLLLAVPIAALCVLRRHRRGLALFATATAIVWLTFRQTAYLRYVFPSFALAAAGVGVGLGGGLGTGRIAARTLGAAMLAATTLGTLYLGCGGYYATLSLPALFGTAERDAYITERRPLRAAVALVNGLNERGAPVAFFCQPYGTGLHAKGIWTNWYNPTFGRAALTVRTPEEMGSLIAREGVRYLLLRESWRDEARRELVRAVSDEVHVVADVSVRRLRDEYRFRTELLAAPRFEDPKRWSVTESAVVQPGIGARVRTGASATQRVDVVAGREYRLEALVRRADADVAAHARLQVNWHAADGRRLHTDIDVVACEAESRLHSMDRTAPAGTAYAVVYAVSHGDAAVLFESLSFRN